MLTTETSVKMGPSKAFPGELHGRVAGVTAVLLMGDFATPGSGQPVLVPVTLCWGDWQLEVVGEETD